MRWKEEYRYLKITKTYLAPKNIYKYAIKLPIFKTEKHILFCGLTNVFQEKLKCFVIM